MTTMTVDEWNASHCREVVDWIGQIPGGEQIVCGRPLPCPIPSHAARTPDAVAGVFAEIERIANRLRETARELRADPPMNRHHCANRLEKLARELCAERKES